MHTTKDQTVAAGRSMRRFGPLSGRLVIVAGMDTNRNVGRIAAAVGVFALLAAGCSGGTDRGGRAATAHTAAQAQAWLAALVPWDFRGAVGLVEGGRGDREVFASGFGARDPEQGSGTVGPRTRFAIGSVTKLITRMAVLLLEDRGKLHDDDRLGDLLARVPPDKVSITVGQLAAHTAGLPDYHGLDEEQLTKAEALARIFDQELLFAPGSEESYSNSGYTVLAAIVEEVSGRGFDDFLREEVFAPAGMTDAGFQGDPLPPGGNEAVGSSAAGATDTPSRLPPVGWALRGNGGVVASSNDLLALDHAVFHGDLLSDAARQRLVDETESEVEGLVLAAGGGGLTSHTSLVARQLEDDRVLVVLSADERFAAEHIAPRLLDLIKGEEVPAPPQVGELDRGEIAGVTGTYRSAAGARVTVAAHPDGLRLVTQDGRAFGDLFPLPDQLPGIAPTAQVVRLVAALDDPDYRAWRQEQTAVLGPLRAIEPVGVAPAGEPEPVTFLRHRFARGSRLTGWVFSRQGEALAIDLEPDPPVVTFRPAAGDDGGFVSYSVTRIPIADHVRFADNGVMTLQVEGRSVDYRRDG